MSTNPSAVQKVIPSRRVLFAGLMIILGIAVTTGFVWMQTDQVIAPPGLRLMEAYWRFFICWCPIFPDLLNF
jgi:hypothetical protein